MLRLISVLLLLAGLALAGFASLRLFGSEAPMPAPPPPPPLERSAASESADIGAAPSGAPVPPPEAETASAEPMFEMAGSRPNPASALREVPIAHETPEFAVLGDVFEVTLAIDATGASSAARTMPGTGNIVEGTAMVGEEAKVLLTGTNFEIEGLSPDTQTLSSFAANTWRWRVKAVEYGPQDLVLEVFAMDGSRALPVRSYRDTVSVQVTTVGRLVNAANEANPIVMLLGGIGSIIGGAVGVFRFFRR